MQATYWEFKNRALVFGLIFGVSFGAYFLDPQNAAAALANWVGPRLRTDPDRIARFLFALAACLLMVFAWVRTWASSYLHAKVVYASEVKSESLVADGPYRHIRNPLYFGNIVMAIGLGALMSRIGFFLAIVSMPVFCYRLIFREEAELEASQGEHYERYWRAVPRLWPSLRPRIPSAGHEASWIAGFKAEFWAWGSVIATAVFAVTLNVEFFLIILAASIGLLWLSTVLLQRKARTVRPTDS
jgi:protein-S-isoprenylcysteine O-methyltransferase Ste14